MLAQYCQQLFRNINSLRNVIVWTFLSTVFAALGADLSQGVKARVFSLLRKILGSEQRAIL